MSEVTQKAIDDVIDCVGQLLADNNRQAAGLLYNAYSVVLDNKAPRFELLTEEAQARWEAILFQFLCQTWLAAQNQRQSIEDPFERELMAQLREIQL